MVRSSEPKTDKNNQGDNSSRRPAMELSSRKRTMTLDLEPAGFNRKKSRFDLTKTSAPVLSSPDLQMLKLNSPELEKLISQNTLLNSATPTPTTNAILFPKPVTEEQEMYARGFEEALNEIRGSDSSQGASQAIDVSSNSSSNTSMTYTDLDPQTMGRHGACYNNLSPLGIVIKDEPQTVPSICSTPPMSPINMECQEIIKLERKRQRNRVAASKCRKRKLERIARLEDKVKLLKGENTDLSTVVLKLKDQVCLLKEQVMEHIHSGCEMMVTNQFAFNNYKSLIS